MSYLKLCQLSTDTYIEDCNAQVILATSIVYPLTLSCEVIDWDSEDEFIKRGKADSFTSIEVILQEQPQEIREAVYQQLLLQFPELIK